MGISRSFCFVAPLLACGAVFGLAPPRASADAPACRTACASGEVFDEGAGCCVVSPELAEVERRARAAELDAVAAARAELEQRAAAELAAVEAEDAAYRTTVFAGTIGWLSNYLRMDHPGFGGEVARSSVFRLAVLGEISAPLLRREPDRRPLLSLEASIAAEAPFSYIGSFMFLPGLRGELRLRGLYVAPLVYSEIQWFRVRLHVISTADPGPREQGRASSGGFGVSIGDYGRSDGTGWVLNGRWGPLVDGGRAHFAGELRIFEDKVLYELYFRGFDELGDFTHGFWIGLAYGVTR